MSVLLSGFLEVFQVSLFWLTQFYGGHLASAIISFSLLARLLLLPLTVPLAVRAREHARRIRAIRPELERVQAKWKGEDPERMAKETLAVYKRHGVKPVDSGLIKGSLVQTPVFIGLFRAVQDALSSISSPQAFLWVKDLARPDIGVSLLAAALVGAGSMAASTDGQPRWALVVPGVMTFAMAMFLSSGFALYLGSSGLVSTLQGLLVQRAEARLPDPV